MSDEELAEISKRVRNATSGPWIAADEHGLILGAGPAWCVCQMRPGYEEMDETVVDGRGRRGGYLGDVADIGDSEADAEFIAHAREDVPALVAEITRLRAQVAAVRYLCDLADNRGDGRPTTAQIDAALATEPV